MDSLVDTSSNLVDTSSNLVDTSSNLVDSSLNTYYQTNNINRPYQSSLNINSNDYTTLIHRLRSFFKSKNFKEVFTQNRLSILAACEDPFNVGTFNYCDNCWPLPQTGQMWLEYELLKNPEADGFFCLTTSYRMEKEPKQDRHDLIFPLFEFEAKGGMDRLIELEKELLEYLGYDKSKFVEGKYNDIASRFETTELDHADEERLYTEISPTFFLTDFPEFTNPFWNMKRSSGDSSNKVDVILSGQETIGSAERETDKEVMRARFNSIMDGGYKEKLYELFGKERTDIELEDYLNFDFFERCGGGIGITRLLRSLKKERLL